MPEGSDVLQLYLPFLVMLVVGIIFYLNFRRMAKSVELQKKVLDIFVNNQPHPVSETQIIVQLTSPPHPYKKSKVISVIRYLKNMNKIQKTEESGKQVNVYRLTNS
jgi:hypothetical protein